MSKPNVIFRQKFEDCAMLKDTDNRTTMEEGKTYDEAGRACCSNHIDFSEISWEPNYGDHGRMKIVVGGGSCTTTIFCNGLHCGGATHCHCYLSPDGTTLGTQSLVLDEPGTYYIVAEESDLPKEVADPEVTTLSATNVETTTATVRGEVTDTGGENPTRYVQWGTTTSMTSSANKGVGGTGIYTHDLSGLDPATKYYFRAYATNDAGTGYGTMLDFTTDKGDQAKPSAPTMHSRTQTSITLNTLTGGEYRRNGGSWQDSTIFSGLSVGTSYSFTQRLKETSTHNASPESDSASFSTEKGDQAKPSAPTLDEKSYTSITLNTIAGGEYRRDGGAWQDSPTFSGLSQGTQYSFTQRLKETATHNASPESDSASFTTIAIEILAVDVPVETSEINYGEIFEHPTIKFLTQVLIEDDFVGVYNEFLVIDAPIKTSIGDTKEVFESIDILSPIKLKSLDSKEFHEVLLNELFIDVSALITINEVLNIDAHIELNIQDNKDGAEIVGVLIPVETDIIDTKEFAEEIVSHFIVDAYAIDALTEFRENLIISIPIETEIIDTTVLFFGKRISLQSQFNKKIDLVSIIRENVDLQSQFSKEVKFSVNRKKD